MYIASSNLAEVSKLFLVSTLNKPCIIQCLPSLDTPKNVGTRIYKVLGVTENLFIRQTKNTNTMYWTIQLSEEMQNRVMKVFYKFFDIPENWTLHCDHITVIHSSHKDWVTANKLLLNFKGKTVIFTIDGIGISETAMAFRVDTYTTNEVSHITIATAPGAKPVESNNIKNWEKLYCTDVFKGILQLKD